jgi:hypothetical protein
MDPQQGMGLVRGDAMRILLTLKPALTNKAGCLLQEQISQVKQTPILFPMREEEWQEMIHAQPPDH